VGLEFDGEGMKARPVKASRKGYVKFAIGGLIIGGANKVMTISLPKKSLGLDTQDKVANFALQAFSPVEGGAIYNKVMNVLRQISSASEDGTVKAQLGRGKQLSLRFISKKDPLQLLGNGKHSPGKISDMARACLKGAVSQMTDMMKDIVARRGMHTHPEHIPHERTFSNRHSSARRHRVHKPPVRKPPVRKPSVRKPSVHYSSSGTQTDRTPLKRIPRKRDEDRGVHSHSRSSKERGTTKARRRTESTFQRKEDLHPSVSPQEKVVTEKQSWFSKLVELFLHKTPEHRHKKMRKLFVKKARDLEKYNKLHLAVNENRRIKGELLEQQKQKKLKLLGELEKINIVGSSLNEMDKGIRELKNTMQKKEEQTDDNKLKLGKLIRESRILRREKSALKASIGQKSRGMESLEKNISALDTDFERDNRELFYYNHIRSGDEKELTQTLESGLRDYVEVEENLATCKRTISELTKEIKRLFQAEDQLGKEVSALTGTKNKKARKKKTRERRACEKKYEKAWKRRESLMKKKEKLVSKRDDLFPSFDSNLLTGEQNAQVKNAISNLPK